MAPQVDALQYLLGKLEAIELLASSLAAATKPAVAAVMLQQCAGLRERAARGEELSDKERGFASIEANLFAAIRTAADAERVSQLPPNATAQ